MLEPNKSPKTIHVHFKKTRRKAATFKKLPTMPAAKIRQLRSLTTLELTGQEHKPNNPSRP